MASMQIRITVAAGVLLIFGLAASNRVAHADANQGWYVGGGAGQYSTYLQPPPALPPGDYYGLGYHSTSYELFGGYRFAPYLAVEASYLDLGSVDKAGELFDDHVSGWAPWLVATLPLGNSRGPLGPMELFAKVGNYWYSARGTDVRDSFHENDSGLVWGGGIGLVIAQRLALRVEYDGLNFPNATQSYAVLGTLEYRF